MGELEFDMGKCMMRDGRENAVQGGKEKCMWQAVQQMSTRVQHTFLLCRLTASNSDWRRSGEANKCTRRMSASAIALSICGVAG